MGTITDNSFKPAVRLMSRYDWDIWYDYIQKRALEDDIWIFIDPESLAILNMPFLPA